MIAFVHSFIRYLLMYSLFHSFLVGSFLGSSMHRRALGDDALVVLDPPDARKLEFSKKALAAAAAQAAADRGRPKGQLSRLRYDLNQVLLGRERDIPDYDDQQQQQQQHM